MKKIVFILVFLMLFSLSAFAETKDKIIEDLTKDSSESFGKVSEIIDSDEDFLDFDAEKIIKSAARGEKMFSFQEVLKKTVSKFLSEASVAAKAMTAVFAVSLLLSFLPMAKEAKSGSCEYAAKLCVYMISAGITASVFSKGAAVAESAVKNLSLFLKSIFPVIIASLYSSGAAATAAVIRPTVVTAIQFFLHLTEKLLIPLSTVCFAVCCVNILSGEINADRFITFLTKSIKNLLTAVLIIFGGIVSLEAVATSSADGLSVKLSKFAASNLVPVVGGILSESVETVMGCGRIIKNSVGICGILATVYICLSPLLKLGATTFVLRFSAAVMEPVCDKRIIKCISDASEIISLLLAIVSSVAVMFVLIITIIINIGNSVFMFGG